ncbi:2-dehydro-3-deoxy-6-phosphogalactonate aldolase [Fulvimarina endophytica]|uniref:2-dehydro-3-deoxy-6-phosphogalactonate aldolase n=1 Tax=Fulvimarina endophytica TaxID=2293836 RepID=A0A371WZT1_9HYPH|nr:2-dehydro-3-deoxy-6-phosphogalactonate aldolase [Fulvimarina endophytica]RFC62469.1 2-dehydro-3-deoxy-6-phosphogalactonate aldolase [Fulvimarina endophytica]
MFEADCPWPSLDRDLVAILRGIRLDEVEPIVGVLVETGFQAIEIPLNSPDPFVSIEKAARLAPEHCLIGAGTVLSVEDVSRLDDVGGRLLVAPNVDREVLEAAHSFGMVTMPGVFTPSEAFSALKAKASALKFFPASVLGAKGIAAIRAVLPASTLVGAVGGVGDEDFASYAKAGVRAFGLGSSLYKPGFTAAEVRERASAAVEAFDRAFDRA